MAVGKVAVNSPYATSQHRLWSSVAVKSPRIKQNLYKAKARDQSQFSSISSFSFLFFRPQSQYSIHRFEIMTTHTQEHNHAHPHGYHDEHDNIHSEFVPLSNPLTNSLTLPQPWPNVRTTLGPTTNNPNPNPPHPRHSLARTRPIKYSTNPRLCKWPRYRLNSKSLLALISILVLTTRKALFPLHPLATFQGIDIATAQVERFNAEVAKLAAGEGRIFAIQGDLTSPSAELKGKEWYNFDLAIISMALHHITNPISMLTHLRERVRKGGVIVVVDWLIENNPDDVALGEGSKYDEAKMKKLEHGPKIWSGFSERGILDDFKAAGCEGAKVRMFPVDLREAPEFMRGQDRLFIAKGVVV
jgi:SAM-dependent methyltransferase